MSGAARAGLVAIVGAYLLACAGASLLIALPGRPRCLLLLPVAFGTLHLAYGSGFLAGLFLAAKRTRRNAARQSGGRHEVDG